VRANLAAFVAKRGILMPLSRRWMDLTLVAAVPLFVVATALAQDVAAPTDTTPPPVVHHHKHHKAQKPLILPPLPGGPLSQVPMEQIPSSPAKVSYQGGLLSISAQNATLGEILKDVRQLTGASIEIPPTSGANERVVTHLGPGAPRDVLVGLLNGSSFNYVMLGSNTDPAAISSIILTAKTSSPGDIQPVANIGGNVYESTAAAAVPGRFPVPQAFSQANLMVPQQQGGVQPAGAQAPAADADDAKDDEENADDKDDAADDQAQAQPGQPDASGISPEQQQLIQQQQAQQQLDPNQPNAGPKTPEQILEMLRRPQQPGGSVINPPQPPQD
jgi:hypothetical protein